MEFRNADVGKVLTPLPINRVTVTVNRFAEPKDQFDQGRTARTVLVLLNRGCDTTLGITRAAKRRRFDMIVLARE